MSIWQNPRNDTHDYPAISGPMLKRLLNLPPAHSLRWQSYRGKLLEVRRLSAQHETGVIDDEVIRTPTMKYHPPDTTACIFWLKNRQPEQWRDKPASDHPEKEVIIVHNALQIPGAVQPKSTTSPEGVGKSR